MLLNSVKFWQINRIEWERAKKPSLPCYSKEEQSTNYSLASKSYVYDQRFLKSLPSSSFASFLKN